jgi:homoprotocatechuate degradation regulator HpaR
MIVILMDGKTMPIEQFSHSLPMMLYRTLDAVMPRFRTIFNDFGITEQQWRVLRVLWELDAVTLNRLAELTLIPAPSLVGIVDRLELAHLVNRHRSEADRRKVNIVLTTQGAALEDDIMPRVASMYADLKQAVDPQAWDNVLKGLSEIVAVSEDA